MTHPVESIRLALFIVGSGLIAAGSAIVLYTLIPDRKPPESRR